MEIFLAMILIWGLSVWSKKNVRKTKEDRTSERPIQRTPSAAAVREEAQR